MAYLVNHLDHSHGAMEAGQAASRRRVEQLFQSLLHQAFAGESQCQ